MIYSNSSCVSHFRRTKMTFCIVYTACRTVLAEVFETKLATVDAS